MNETSSGGHPLPADRAFVVQLYAEADVARGRLAGRIEHVVSGQAMHFDGLEDLLAFIERVVVSLHAEAPCEPPEET
jgi:hypothetical protein